VLNAMKSGLRGARAAYVVVTMGDGSDDAKDIDPMYQLALAGADVVAGSRYMRGGRQLGGPLLKRTMSRTAGLSLHWLGGVPIHDATSNFRLYSKRLLNQVTIESTGGFELGIELDDLARPHRGPEPIPPLAVAAALPEVVLARSERKIRHHSLGLPP
jgi:hypothetical protein